MDVLGRDRVSEIALDPNDAAVPDAGWIEGLLARIREADGLAFDNEGD
jgi:hypothetical protein